MMRIPPAGRRQSRKRHRKVALQFAAQADQCVAIGIYARDLHTAIGQGQRRIDMVVGALSRRRLEMSVRRPIVLGAVQMLRTQN